MVGLLRVPVVPLVGGEILLDEATGRFVTRVHRLGPGDHFEAFDPQLRLEADATVISRGRSVACRVGPTRPARVVAARSVTLLQSIGKGDKLDQVVRDATALGATRIVAVQSERTVVRLGERARSRGERWNAIALQAARQCGRGDLPRVDGPFPLEAALDLFREPGRVRICFDVGAERRFRDALQKWRPDQELVLLIGPEGGLSPAETAAATAVGFTLARFGRFVLRTELAAAAALSAVASRTE